MDAISSSEDLEAWFEYFRLPTEGWTGDEIPELELDLAANDSVQGLPLSGLMNQAYAAIGKKPKRIDGKKAADKLKKTLRDLKSGAISDIEGAQAITKAMSSILKATGNVRIRDLLSDPKVLVAGSTVAIHAGQRHFRNLLRGKDDNGKAVTSRTPLFLQIAAIAYLESKISASCEKNCFDDSTSKGRATIDEIRKLYVKAIGSPIINGYDSAIVGGHQFHLTLTALMHLWGQYASPYGKLVAIEQREGIKLWRLKNGQQFANPFSNKAGDYSRSIDIVTQVEGEDLPRFIEVKSYKGQKKSGGKLQENDIKSRFALWSLATKKKGSADAEEEENKKNFSAHKQYMLDRIMTVDNDLIKDGDDRKDAWKAQEIHWFFHHYKQASVSSYDEGQMKLIRKQMSNNAKGEPSMIAASLGQEKYNKTTANTQAKAIKLFNIKTILKDSASSGLLEELFEIEGSSEEKAKQREKIEEFVIALIP